MVSKTTLSVLIMGLVSLTTHTAYADLNVSAVLTVEWLVSNSDGIFLVKKKKENDELEVIHSLKGDPPESFRSLSKISSSTFKRSIFSPPSRGKVTLIFLNRLTVLQEVELSRDRDASPSLYLSFYGVTETGRIITDEPSLIRKIRICLDEDRGKIVPRIPQIPKHKILQFPAPPWFVFESGGDIYSLVVRNDEHFRDELVGLAKSGVAAERIWSVRCLATNDDKISVNAVKRLAANRPAIISKSTATYRRSGKPGKSVQILDGQSVQDFARDRLEWLRSDRRSIGF